MHIFYSLVNKFFIFGKEPQKIGLSQFKQTTLKNETTAPSINKKDVKLSDLMRRAG